MPRQTTPLIAVLILVIQLVLASSAIYSAYALGPPSIRVYQNWELGTARGFEKVMMDVNHYTPTFVLARGTTGVINMTFTTSESNPVPLRVWYGGLHPYTGGWSPNANMSMIPSGIIYTIEPYSSGNVTVVPNANTTITLRISAAPETEVREYNLFLTVIAGGGLEDFGYPTILTIVKGNTSTTTTNTTCVSSYINSTVTTTVTSTSTVTVTSTNSTTRTITTAATPNLSTTITTPTTTVSTTLVSTTTAISTERVTEPSIYAWAIGATAIAAVLAVVLLRKRG